MPAPSYSLSPQEASYYKQLYASIHGDRSGVSADAVVNLFAKATPNLSTTVLGEVWNMADYESSGSLTPQGFEIACRLVGHAQTGQSVTQDLVNRAGPLPKFEGFSPPSTVSPQPVGGRTPAVNNTSFANARVAPADREKFMRMFHAQQPTNGLLNGEKASTVFLKSNLPPTTLADIWRLADTKERGELDSTDFIIGMHLVQKVMSGSMQAPLPVLLPPGLYESAAGSGSSATSAPSLPPAASVARQYTGQQVSSPPRASSPLRQQYTGQPFARAGAAMPSSSGWSITPTEKAQSDSWFDGLQQNSQGLIEGPAAVEFFMKSTLDQPILAAIWDLCDMRNSGTLNKDEFAVATRLINDQLDGKPMPTALPADLIPPSQRSGSSQQRAPQTSSAVERDLFSLLDDDEPAASLPAASAPRSVASPPPRSVASPAPTTSRLTSPAPAYRSVTKSPEPVGDAPFASSGAEIGNLKNQLASTSSSLEKTRKDRAQIETVVNNSSSDLAALQAQLEAARTAYTTESSLLSSLQTRAANQTTELAELRSKLITAESDLSGLRVERAEVEQSVLRDKEEIRQLKAKIAELDRETERLKAEAEGKKKEARQQKGMVAITKKQVERAEEQKDRAGADLAAVATPVESAESTRAVSPPPVASPATSVRSTNPFERMTLGGATPQPTLSPQPTGTSTVSKALSPQPTGSRAAPPPPPSRGRTMDVSPTTTSSSGLTGAAVAIAAGATAAAGALAAGVTSLVGSDSEETKSTPAPATSAAEESASPRKSTEERFPEVDEVTPVNTAVPPTAAIADSTRSMARSVSPQDPPVPSTSTAAFDEAFGAPVSSAGPSTSGFDDAFGGPPTVNAAPSGFDDAFGSARSSSIPPAAAPSASAGFDDAFGASAPSAAAPASAFDDAFGASALPTVDAGGSKAAEAAEDSDSDDEDGPEPAEGYQYGRHAAQQPSNGVVAEQSPFEELPPALPGHYDGGSRGQSVEPVRPPSAAPSSVDAFEDAQQNVVNSPVPAQTAHATSGGGGFNDDFDAFDREFDDLPAGSAAPIGQTKVSSGATAMPEDDDDDFAKEFDRLDDFSAPPPHTGSTAVPSSNGVSSSAFNSAFADFDSSPPASATTHDGGFASAFDDSFGAPASAPAPALPARRNAAPEPTPAKDDDVQDVKEVCALGFSRTQAIEALEKHSYNVQAAINSLLDAQ